MTLKKVILFLAIGVLFVIAGCGDSTSEKIYSHLEEAVKLEGEFIEQQHPITDLEKQEQELYNQIIDLGMDEFDEIKQLSQQAIEIIDERGEIIDLEKSSIDASKAEFEQTKSLIEQLKEQSIKDKANDMYATMMKRYEAYDVLNKAYSESLKLEKELYAILQQEDVEQEALTAHINDLNASYEAVFEANDTFNAYTTEYNELKKEFYKAAELNVKYEDDSE